MTGFHVERKILPDASSGPHRTTDIVWEAFAAPANNLHQTDAQRGEVTSDARLPRRNRWVGISVA
jgi:hypothetical protein